MKPYRMVSSDRIVCRRGSAKELTMLSLFVKAIPSPDALCRRADAAIFFFAGFGEYGRRRTCLFVTVLQETSCNTKGWDVHCRWTHNWMNRAVFGNRSESAAACARCEWLELRWTVNGQGDVSNAKSIR